MMFGTTQYMTFTGKPKGEVVAEGANKSQSQPAFGTKTVDPPQGAGHHAVQRGGPVGRRGLPARRPLPAATPAEALARALDLIVYHGINPLTGRRLSGSPAKVLDTTNTVEVATAKPGRRHRLRGRPGHR
jgi:hypothetical protein